MFPKLIHHFYAIKIKVSTEFFKNLDKRILNVYEKSTAKRLWKKELEVSGLTHQTSKY